MSFKACIAVGLMCFSGLALADGTAYIKCDSSARYVPRIEMVVEEVHVNSQGTVVSYIDNNGKHYSLVGYTCFIDHDYNYQPDTESRK